MTQTREPNGYEMLRQNWEKTTAFLLAGSDPCIKIRDEELEVNQGNRVLVGLSFDDLRTWEPSGSWMLAVLLCPGDTTERLATWAAKRDIDTGRVHFYLHPETAWGALETWHEAGYPTDQVDDDIDSWERLHSLFGLDLSEQIYKDWRDREDSDET